MSEEALQVRDTLPTYGVGNLALDVPPGYKPTEVGVIPENWNVVPIGEIFDARAGGDLQPHRSSDIQSDAHQYPIFANGLTDGGLYGFCSYAEAKTGSITVTARGTLGAAFYRPVPFVAIGRLLVLEPRLDMDSRFFAEYINSHVEFAIESTGVPQLTAPQVVRYHVPLPPKSEQRAIAEALSDVDGLLGALEALIAKKRAIKQAAMQQLLTGKTRLPGFSGEWETKSLPQVCEFRGGKAHEKYIAEFGDFVCVNSKFVSTDGKERKYSTANFCLARKNDILMVMSDLPNGRALAKAYLVEQDDLYAVNQRVCALTAYSDCPQFLAYILNRNPYFLKFDDGVSQTHLLNNVFLNCSLHVPSSVIEQSAIATVLSDMDADIAALESRRDKTRAIKQGMMQQLLTGRVRLVKPEQAA